MEEPLEEYLEVFDVNRGKVEELLEATADLSRLEDHALAILSDRKLLEAFRYLAGPFISLDDLKILADAATLSAKALRKDPDLVQRVVETVRIGLDRRRFPWVAEKREPGKAERYAAVLASAALMATQRVATRRRTASTAAQEQLVKEALKATETFQEVPAQDIKTLSEAPQPGELCGECMFGSRKADVVVAFLMGGCCRSSARSRTPPRTPSSASTTTRPSRPRSGVTSLERARSSPLPCWVESTSSGTWRPLKSAASRFSGHMTWRN